ncbi:uncharacterized protein LOC129775499 [Toxorhynchites rutilus septentrionalis]|uniref:uncharacterized protein LOC129775499 n=1 Tax=Toxorhynchites rutilus septentrionalis TaxID=329112 RepID=UPI00247B1730|nr:uncharacterized protein LOC129775499 [Toxorhynchites rutilus septentrionalis]
MKTIATYFLLIGALVATGYAYPAHSESNPADDAEFIVVPLEHQKPSYFNRYPSGFDTFDGVVDTGDFPHPAGQSPVFFPSINPFSWQFSSYLDDLIRRLRDRFSGSWNPFYGDSGFGSSGPGLWPIDIPDDSSEDGQKNSTSTVKVIDGHKVIINDTYYTKKNEFGTSIFKVRVIDVKPADEEGEGEKPTETGNRVGGDDDSKKDEKEPATEQPKRDTELEASEEETTAADDNLNTIDANPNNADGSKKDEPYTSSELESLEAEELLAQVNEFYPGKDSVERNALRAELNKDREDSTSSAEATGEDFSPDEWKQYHDDRKRIVVNAIQNQIPKRNQNQLEEDAPAVDLSNDIAINEMLADRAIAPHPDVEVFAPNRKRPTQQDPMQSFPIRPPFPQSFPGGNQYPVQYPILYPQQFPQYPAYPQRPLGQFPVQSFPMLGPQWPGQQLFPVQRPVSLSQQAAMPAVSFPQDFTATVWEVRP